MKGQKSLHGLSFLCHNLFFCLSRTIFLDPFFEVEQICSFEVLFFGALHDSCDDSLGCNVYVSIRHQTSTPRSFALVYSPSTEGNSVLGEVFESATLAVSRKEAIMGTFTSRMGMVAIKTLIVVKVSEVSVPTVQYG